MRLAVGTGIVLAFACTRPAGQSAAPVQRDDVTLESMRPPPEPGTRQISGLVKSFDGAMVSLDSGGPNPIPLRIEPSTSVTIDGNAASAGQIPEGDLVRAAYRFRDGEPVAIQVVANQRAVPTARVTQPLPAFRREVLPAKPLQR